MVEIPIHPAFLGKTSIGEGKSVVSTEKVLIDTEKNVDSFPKVSFASAKSVVSSGNTMFDALVDAMLCGDKVKNNVRKLYEEYESTIFGRTDIVNCLGLSSTAAGNLINKMHTANLIEPITGHGKGKYRFL